MSLTDVRSLHSPAGRLSESWSASVTSSTDSRARTARQHHAPPPQPIELPSPVPALRARQLPSRPRDSTDDEFLRVEHSDTAAVPVVPAPTNTLGLHVVNNPPKRRRPFVGGFAATVKRAFRRHDKETVWRSAVSPETGPVDFPQPMYISTTPPSPEIQRPSMPAARPPHVSLNEESLPQALASGEVHRRRQENHKKRAPRVDVANYLPASPTEVPIASSRTSAQAGPSNFPGSFRPAPRPEPSPGRPQSPPEPRDSDNSQRQSALLSPHPSHGHSATPHTSPPSHPTSVQAHPPLAHDYRRMSATKPEGTMSMGSDSEPSFATELNPVHRFWTTIHDMPWISSDRVSRDYFPGMSRGAWTWRWAKRHHDVERVKVQVPINKPKVPWYNTKRGNAVVEDNAPTPKRLSATLTTPRHDPLDLLSSGDSSGSPLSVVSYGNSTSLNSRRRRSTRHHDKRRSVIIFPAPENVYAQSPTLRNRRKHEASGRIATHRGTARRPRDIHGHRETHNRHRDKRRHGGTSGSGSSRSKSPASTLTPAGGGFYVPMPGTVPPVPPLPPSFSMPSPWQNFNQSQPAVSPGQRTAQGSPGQPPMYYTPVFMQVVPPPKSSSLPPSEANTSPGVAGLGAGATQQQFVAPMMVPAYMPGQFPPQ